ncbi:hypothetical protein ASE75_08740 [Sphingomonas sp. Leaf17]|uniref:SIMPL domain-containing protein n=1 Tax=Sphingomonas sp. Leaf17 TaxID=1735683 RepID=UPI0006F29542|nr:SIMPL domain-containing protein [Sphingomonas sp. Leaf17]KQM65116.1 hypothetical protein ASE75_08740 [Sphingomonas sp. Leaf17]
MFIAGALLALLLSSPVGAQEARLMPNETLLEVEAYGQVKAVPDQAEFSTGVTTDGRTARAAMETNAVAAHRLIEAVTSAGLPPIDQRTSNLSVRAQYRKDADGDDTSEIIGYRATNRLTLTIRNIQKATSILDALAKASATEVDGPNFSFRDDEPLKTRARQNAIAAASREADDYAGALGLRRSRVIRVSERAARSVESSDIVVTGSRVAGAPISPGQQAIGVTVWVDYTLVPKE